MRVCLVMALLLVGCGGETATAPDPQKVPVRTGSLKFEDGSLVTVFVVPDYGFHLVRNWPDGTTDTRDLRYSYGPDPEHPGKTLERETLLAPDGSWFRTQWQFDGEDPQAPVTIISEIPGEERRLRIRRQGNLGFYTLTWTLAGEQREASVRLDLSQTDGEAHIEARRLLAEKFEGFPARSRLDDSGEAEYLRELAQHPELETLLAGAGTGTRPSGIDFNLREFCNMGRNLQKVICALGLISPHLSGLCLASVAPTSICDLILSMRTARGLINDPAEGDSLCPVCSPPPPDSTGGESP
jgi:hypothetical protein